MNEPDETYGLTKAEDEVMDALCKAANAFASLPFQHPSDRSEFVSAIHQCQALLACRIARRAYPLGWTTHREGN